MTTERREPALDAAIRHTLRARETRRVVPAFDELWAEAERRGELAPGAAAPCAARARRWPAFTAAAGMTLVVGIGVLRFAERPPDRATGQVRAPSAATVDLEAFPRPEPVIWYAPTDALLQIPALRYGAQPASLTYYDPIHLEVRE